MKRRKAAIPPKGSKAVFDQSKEVRTIARERVGPVKPGRVVAPKTARKKPKHKQAVEDEGL